MSGASLDANLLVVFDALLREPRISHACENLGMSASAMSAAVARLRVLLDDPIVIRSGKSVTLSPKAQAMAPLIRDAMVSVERTLRVGSTFDHRTSRRTFSIVASDFSLASLTSPLLRAIDEQAPGISVSFETLPVDPMQAGTALLRHDVVVVAASGRVPGQRQSLFVDEFVCVVDGASPLGHGSVVTVAQLAEVGHVAVGFGETVATPVDLALAGVGISPRRVMTTRGFGVAPFLVAGTDLVTFVPRRLAEAIAAVADVRIVATELPRTLLDEAAHWNPNSTSDPALQWLLRQMRKVGAQLTVPG